MRDHLDDAENYIHWVTPAFRRQISVGDPAYIWLSGGGIISIGEVAEAPQEYDGNNTEPFAHEDRLEAPGWNEGNTMENRDKTDWRSTLETSVEARY
jgi:hypothetical protein